MALHKILDIIVTSKYNLKTTSFEIIFCLVLRFMYMSNRTFFDVWQLNRIVKINERSSLTTNLPDWSAQAEGHI